MSIRKLVAAAATMIGRRFELSFFIIRSTIYCVKENYIGSSPGSASALIRVLSVFCALSGEGAAETAAETKQMLNAAEFI